MWLRKEQHRTQWSLPQYVQECSSTQEVGRRKLTKEGNAHFRNNKACPEFIYLSVNKGTESTKKNSLSCSLSGESQDDLCVGKRFKSYTLSRVG